MKFLEDPKIARALAKVKPAERPALIKKAIAAMPRAQRDALRKEVMADMSDAERNDFLTKSALAAPMTGRAFLTGGAAR
jgi:hypothetical protein